MPVETHSDFQVIKLVVNVKGKEPFDVPVKGADSITVTIPGGVKYHMTMHFQVKNKKYEDLRYIQVAKKAGITIRTRELEIGTYEPSEETVYTKDFPEDETPGSWLARGIYSCNSTYYAGDEELFSNDWNLEIVAK
ncbi:hypothetical protein MG5_01354 [Candida albicans P57072]|uniref:Rho GDP-dissociation inhibitor n=4 Tax=Candida albicans TaxID=5476 RepID=A0A1D8PFU1_CANAL|nr:uncharacterized protein CAALFM_C114020WA [Candida albicans SC5314]EEQ41864.1 conserved hypothetical protein [Candida albicans WO-1]KAF6069588.1 RHO protein GDP dissociation inhibitor family protein [Candida albicans]KGQ91039.1 hypothetical protein MEO_01359 [Candida albicans P94015]KGQ97547.1 hypothetical protein MEU_01361 [Candida albicans P37005]KGR02155.1 hypothetical protein MG1_01371 [Candida albicans GC75]KGR14613.1 hypothetical protein MG5_01354 [Candida albicans P57072]KGR16679.1 |eukprot:XP_715010.1 hypothetical protein CAALFM_C114020WA [Candida albicans SC5314]